MTYRSCRFLFHQFIQRDKAHKIIADADALATLSAALVRRADVSIGTNSVSFFASRLVAKAMCFALQAGLGQSKEGRRCRSVSAIAFFNFSCFLHIQYL